MTRQNKIKALLKQHQRRLQKRKLQEAQYGINTPPEISIEIEDITAQIAQLQAELATLTQLSSETGEPAPSLAVSEPEKPEPARAKTAAVDISDVISEPDLAQLQKALFERNLVVFVGSGFSELAGLPARYELMRELSDRIGYELPPPKWATGDALLDAAQAYINRQGLNDLIRFLLEKLDTAKALPTAAHHALAQLPVSLVFTANYNDLLQEAFEEAGKRVNIVTRDSYIPFMGQGKNEVNIIKLYGDLRQPDTLVLARQQFEAYFSERPQTVKLLETALTRSDALYVGWSHTDPFFNLILGQLLNQLQDFSRRGYATLLNLTQTQTQDLEKRKNIRLLPLLPGQNKAAQLARLFGLLNA